MDMIRTARQHAILLQGWCVSTRMPLSAVRQDIADLSAQYVLVQSGLENMLSENSTDGTSLTSMYNRLITLGEEFVRLRNLVDEYSDVSQSSKRPRIE